MRARSLPVLVVVVVVVGGACRTDPVPQPPIEPTANLARDIMDTALEFDVGALTATATITFGPSTTPGASLEIGSLAIDTVTVGGVVMPHAIDGKRLDLGLPASDAPIAIDIAYRWTYHEGFEGASQRGYTLLWPYHCGNLFPCHSDPADGTTFSLDVTGVPGGSMAVYPASIPDPAPAYQIAWAIDAYTQLDLGRTSAGTLISVWHRANEMQRALAGTQNLVAAFDWLEQTIGPYRFGDHAGTISVAWPAGAYGGMEHHPRWHVGASALASEETNVHEAAHGWFGGSVRIQCWEDFVLSEGTVTYLAARALDVVAPTIGQQTWQTYAGQLAQLNGADPVWPQSCGQIDVIEDNLFTSAPYKRGAFFYKGIADKVGAALVDQAIATFYRANAGKAARMADMLETLHQVTGYDPTACAEIWLSSPTLPTPGPCP
jgi:aminopeptidase N